MAHQELEKLIPIQNPFGQMLGYDCFGCSPSNPIGLQMKFAIDGDAVVCEWSPGEHVQGWTGILHGGIQATLMDEIASWLVFVQLKTSGVTSRMEVNLLKPVRMDKAPFRLRAVLQEMQRNVAIIHVELFMADGTLGADSLMHYYTYPPEVARRKLFYPGIKAFVPSWED